MVVGMMNVMGIFVRFMSDGVSLCEGSAVEQYRFSRS